MRGPMSRAEAREEYDREELIEGMASALWVAAWASALEEAGESFPSGADLMDLAPPPPPEAYTAARKLAREIARKSKRSMPLLWQDAASAAGSHFRRPTLDLFGHYLAMEALGHGVSWFDDHPDFDIKIPDVEAYAYVGDDGEVYLHV